MIRVTEARWVTGEHSATVRHNRGRLGWGKQQALSSARHGTHVSTLRAVLTFSSSPPAAPAPRIDKSRSRKFWSSECNRKAHVEVETNIFARWQLFSVLVTCYAAVRDTDFQTMGPPGLGWAWQHGGCCRVRHSSSSRRRAEEHFCRVKVRTQHRRDTSTIITCADRIIYLLRINVSIVSYTGCLKKNGI